MRLLMFALFALVVACDDAPADPADPVAESNEAAPTPSATPSTPTEEAPTTTTGFIEAKVNGELKRYEYLPARENMVFTRLTKMKAQPNAESEEGFELLLMGFDVRQLELPAVIRGGMREAVRGNLAAAGRMPSVTYRDADGNRYLRIVNDDSLECQSLEGLQLTCTFSGTLNGDAGNVEITEGRVQVLLGSDRLSDSLTEATVGRAADESVERAQEGVDRIVKMR